MEWTQLGIIAGLIVAQGGYLTRLLHREVDGLRNELVPRLDRLEHRFDLLEERYVRHLEHHASS